MDLHPAAAASRRGSAPPTSREVAVLVARTCAARRQSAEAGGLSVAKEIPHKIAAPDASLDTPEARRALSGAMVRRSLSVG